MEQHTAVLSLAVEIGRRLQESGAEIYRAEEAVRRVLDAYGMQDGQVWAIPNCLIASAADEDGRPLTQMRRVDPDGRDVTRLELLNDFCRRVCRETPDPVRALEELKALDSNIPTFPLWARLLGYCLGAGFFALFWGGSMRDAAAGALCGLAIGLFLLVLGRLSANLFIKTILTSFVAIFSAAALVRLGVGVDVNCISIGALMALVPGIMFTNFIRAVMAGDLVAGLFKLTEAIMTGVAIALGAFVAFAAANGLFGSSLVMGGALTQWPRFIPCLWAFLACLGFCLIYNIRGAFPLCCLGGALGWLVYLLVLPVWQSEYIAAFLSATVIAVYSEIMARVRKCPVTGYLLISLFPLVPGAGIYYTMRYALEGNTDLFLQTGLHTLAVAGCLAMGVLVVSSAVRMFITHQKNRSKKT